MLTGDMISAADALAMGLVSRVVPDAQLLDEALAIAGRIAANPARAVRITKRLLNDAQNQRLDDVLELYAALQYVAQETARKRAVSGQVVSVRVNVGGARHIKNNKELQN